MLYQITHDLPPNHPVLDLLAEQIISIDGIGDKWAHILPSSWLIDTPIKTAQEIYEYLCPALPPNTFILVTLFDPNHSAGALPDETKNWILRRKTR
ncbi:MAG: hypothetical protein Q4C86_10565 [bacterium]|nr:hypothetical protein [bacterium]